MSDCISREAAIKELLDTYEREFPTADGAFDLFAVRIMPRVLRNIPAADVEPVRRGRWVRPHWRNSSYCCDCSECGGEAMHREYQWNKKGIYPICPNCGSKMDLEDDNGT